MDLCSQAGLWLLQPTLSEHKESLTCTGIQKLLLSCPWWDRSEVEPTLFTQCCEIELNYPLWKLALFLSSFPISVPLSKSLSTVYSFPGAAVRKYHKLGGNLPQFWRLEVWDLGVGRVTFSESGEREPVSCLWPSFWWFSGNLWCFLTWRSITLILTFMFTWCSPCFQVCV